jgi:pyruvate,water dikinase
MGLVNVIPMVPFCRTPEEADRVLAEMAKQGLVRGEGGLQVYVMCELPSNVVAAEAFAERFDGFSIGSNDLTQLTLGLDRDSGLVAGAFDERDAAVKKMLEMAIVACNKADKYVGICGQGPSDYPDLAKWLVEKGIKSMSLNPDTVIDTWKSLA